MSHIVICQCGKKLSSQQPIAGRRVRCPVCGHAFRAPSEPADTRPVVFISHSAKDDAVAAIVCSTLENQGVRCWIAPRNILAGKEWGEAIIEGISGCRIMVLIFSGHSNQSVQVRREVERAVSKGLVIVPFRIEDVPMAKSLEYFLSSPHWLDALTRPLEPHVRKLGATIQALLCGNSDVYPAGNNASVATKAQSGQPVSRTLLLAGAGVGATLLALIALVTLFWRPAETAHASGPAVPSQIASGERPESEKPGVGPSGVPTAALQPVADVGLRDGTLQVRSLRFDMNYDLPLEFGSENPKPPPWIVVTNQHEPLRAIGPSARLQFQITNNSYEAATLAKVELGLLGVVDLYEDRIPAPCRPQLLRLVDSFEVAFGRPRKLTNVVDAMTLFQDVNEPPSRLRYEVTSDRPEIAEATLDAQHRVQICLLGNEGGSADITVRAANAFDLAKTVTFNVKSEPRPPLALEELPPRTEEVDGPRKLTDVADARLLFADSDNDPPTALRYEVTSDLPEIAQATLDPQNRVEIAIIGKSSGTANITVRATNAYNLSADLTFPLTVHVKGRPEMVPRAPVLVELDPFHPVTSPANSPLGIVKFVVDKETQRLANVQFSHALRRNQFLRPCTSGNLLPEDADTFLRANAGRKFSLDADCSTAWELPAEPSADLLVGTRERQLAAHSPELVGTCHLLVLMVEVIGEDGQRHELYGDHVYLLYSQALPNGSTESVDAPRTIKTMLSDCQDVDLDQALARLLKWCARNNGETVAFQRAQLCGAAPEDLDPLEIAPACFYGDRDSVFRGQASSSSLPENAEVWPRTNVARVFHAACAAHPKLAPLLNAALLRLSADDNPALARRAAYVIRQAGSLPPVAASAIDSKSSRYLPPEP